MNGCGPSLSSPEHKMGSGNILKIEYKKKITAILLRTDGLTLTKRFDAIKIASTNCQIVRPSNSNKFALMYETGCHETQIEDRRLSAGWNLGKSFIILISDKSVCDQIGLMNSHT